jgi:uncharacterized tellurite resistance protein B-like protein
MEPSYLDGRTDAAETMRRLLFAGAISLASADGEISPTEIEVFEKFFGAGAFGEHLDVAKIIAGLPERTQQARDKIAVSRRMQVLRDLCLIARVDSRGATRKQTMLYELATTLEVPTEFVDQMLDASVELD